MLRVYKICLDNNITFSELALYLNYSYVAVAHMFKMKFDIKLDTLKLIKSYFVSRNLISSECDLGYLVDII